MRVSFMFLIFLFLISFVSAVCNEGQIDINSASASQLDNLYGIGLVKAQAIIDYRTSQLFNSVDDLINVSGIGEVTLTNIKNQGLACVVDGGGTNGPGPTSEQAVNTSSQDSSTNVQTKENITTSLNSSSNVQTVVQQKIKEPQVLGTINLGSNTENVDTQNIKSSGNGILDKGKYAIYGLVGFCILLGVLFLVKRKREMREIA